MPERTVAWDIDDCVIATNLNNVFGTPVDVAGIISMQGTVRVKSGEQPGDGGIYSVVSKIIGGTLTFSFADLQSWDVLGILTGRSAESSGSPAALALPLDTRQFPFFALSGRTQLDDGLGELHIFMPKIKITSDFQFGLADNAFVVPEFQGTFIPAPNITRAGKPVVIVPVRYSSTVATNIPPTGLPLIVA